MGPTPRTRRPLGTKIRDRELIEEKTKQLENLAVGWPNTFLHKSIKVFSVTREKPLKNMLAKEKQTIFLSDIVKFTDLTDTLEPERLALVINSYLSEMSAIALESWRNH